MTTAHYTDEHVRLYHGDCIEVMRQLPDASVDAVVTDPPYGLEFMGKEWDSFATYSGGNPNMKPQGTTVGDSSGVTYGYRTKNPRCRNCGKLKRGNGCCKCPQPQWDTRTSESANQFQFWTEEWATEALRVLKPGGHLLAFGGTRTWHRLACAIEDAGFEVRDSIAWMYGSGFPKSLDVSKAMDKANGRQFEDRYALGRHIKERRTALGLSRAEVNEWFGYRDGCEHWERQDPSGARVPTLADWAILRERLGLSDEWQSLVERVEAEREVVTTERNYGASKVEEGKQAYGDFAGEWNVTIPATPLAQKWQGWGTALKPAFEPVVVARKPLVGTVAANVERYGTGALNIDGARIESGSDYHDLDVTQGGDHFSVGSDSKTRGTKFQPSSGRWPANVILDESQAAELDRQSGPAGSNSTVRGVGASSSDFLTFGQRSQTSHDTRADGGASRFFYTAKADSSERPRVDGVAHPTVKPLDLMRYLVRLVTPPGGVVLEPFAGSGTTLEACIVEGFRCIGIEREADYIPLIMQRITKPIEPVMF